MARSRNIKPAFFTNEDLVELPFQDRLLFIGLWTIADREGRLEDRPKKIKMEVFPADDVNVVESLDRLEAAGMIARYQVGDGRYIEVVNFKKHQRPHSKEAASTIPERGEPQPGSAPTPTQDEPGTDLGDGEHALIPDTPLSDTGYLKPSTGNPRDERDEPEAKIAPVNPAAAPEVPTVVRVDPVIDRFETFWMAYPKRMGRDEALHAFRRVDWESVTLEQMLSALEQHTQSIQWTKDMGQYIPRAAKWLNERRWLEQLPEPGQPTARSSPLPANLRVVDQNATTIEEDLARVLAKPRAQT